MCFQRVGLYNNIVMTLLYIRHGVPYFCLPLFSATYKHWGCGDSNNATFAVVQQVYNPLHAKTGCRLEYIHSRIMSRTIAKSLRPSTIYSGQQQGFACDGIQMSQTQHR